MTWTLFIAVARAIPARTPLGYALVLAGAFAPAIVALSLTAWQDGAGGARTLLRRLLISNVPARYYVFAISYMLVVKLTAAGLHRVILGGWPRFDTASLLVIPLAVAFSTPFQAGEEIGW